MWKEIVSGIGNLLTLSHDVQDARKEAGNDSEKLMLQLKVAFLEFEKRFPAAPSAASRPKKNTGT